MADVAVEEPEVAQDGEDGEAALRGLRCPGACGRVLSAPIRLCAAGHAACARHRLCPLPRCGAPVTQLRDSRREAAARAVAAAACPHRCGFRGALDALGRHQRGCSARPAPCALPGCGWRAPPAQLAAHAARDHPDRALPAGRALPAADLFGPGGGHRLLVADWGDVFVFRQRRAAGRLLAALHYVGLPENAANFRFSLELTAAAGALRQARPVAPAPEDEPLPEGEPPPFCPRTSAVLEGEQLRAILADAGAQCVVRVRRVQGRGAPPARRTSVPWF